MKLNRRGLTGTIIYHILLVLLLVFAGLTFPDPPPGEEGILVNFGTDDSGFGELEPGGDDQQAGEPEPPVQEEVMEPVEEQPVQEVRETYTTPDPQTTDQTQDLEETPVRETPQLTAEELERQRLEQERLRQEELERQRLEQERIEQERIERERRAEEERQAQLRQQQADRINNAGRNAFSNQGAGEGEGSEGITEGTGNQGDINGTPEADRYDTGGGLGDGISFGLGSRGAVGALPKPDMSGCEVTQRIVVQVDIQVDRDGNVVSASVANATYQDNCIWNMVMDAARRSRFSADQTANYRQTGWIRYIIVP